MEKKCRYCATIIPKEAKICPNCRKKLGWTWPAKIVAVLFVLFVIGTVAGKSNPPAERAPEAPPPPPIEITSEQLYKEYEANEVAADQKYKNRTLKVVGTIRDIGKSIGDKPYVSLSTGRWSNQVMVSFPPKVLDDKLATYSKGTRIEVTGTCTGMTLGMVMIRLR